MKANVLLGLILILSAAFADDVKCPANPDKVVVCYYSSWSVYREEMGHFNMSHIDATLCTHLVYTFAGLDLDSRITSLDPANDIQRGSYNSFTKLKEENPCLKTLLAIGGWNEGSKKYSVMAYTKESREAFANSVLRFLVAYDFDGLDFDWEYPTQRGGIDADRENFVELVKVLHEKFKIWNLMLTIAVPISREITEKAYDIVKLSPYIDYILLMAYDFTAGNSQTTGLSTPLNFIQDTVNWWLRDLPPNKLVLGIATYSRSYVLENNNNSGIGSNVTGPGPAGIYTKEPGFLSSYELQAKLATKRYTVVPTNYPTYCYYAYYKSEWITFDLEDTYIKKVEYALSKNLRGMMVWTIDTDDFYGLYSNTTYPILNTINTVLNRK